MVLVSNQPVEFRIKREYTSKNSGNKSFFYTFEEDSMGSFELWSQDNLPLEKGKLYKLQFDLTFFNGDRKINLKDVVPVNEK